MHEHLPPQKNGFRLRFQRLLFATQDINETLTEPASSPLSAAEEVIVKGMPKPLLL